MGLLLKYVLKPLDKNYSTSPPTSPPLPEKQGFLPSVLGIQAY